MEIGLDVTLDLTEALEFWRDLSTGQRILLVISIFIVALIFIMMFS